MLGAKKEKQKKAKKEKVKKEKVKKEKKPKKEKKKKEKKPKKDKSGKSGKSKKKLIIIGILVIVLLLGAGFAAYTFLFKGGSHEDSKKDTHAKTEQSAEAEKEKDAESKDSEGTTESAVEANPIGEISYVNYLRIGLGDSYKNVVRLLGEEGKEISATQVDGLSMKEYNFGTSNEITVAFVNDQMVKKSETGLKKEIAPEPSKQTEEKETEKKEKSEH